MDADVIVVGAGPAGSITGLLLARNGLDVLILDRATFPRPKPCGDCLSAAATELLDRLGLLDRVRDAGASLIERWDIVAPGGATATGRFPDRPALALERRLLDATLLDAAVEAGARFRQARVTALDPDGAGRVRGVVTGQGTLTARLVVGADGLRSVVARALDTVRRQPRLRKVSLTAHVPLPDGMRHGEMHVLEGGCLGFAPAGPGRANLTLVVADEHADALRRLGPEAFFMAWLDRVPAVRDRVGRVGPGPLLASGPFDWPSRGPVARGAALVGDAAGYYDPFTGQGIYQAMAAAELLAGAVAPVLSERARDPRADNARKEGWEAGREQTRDERRDEAGEEALDRALRRYAVAKGHLTRPARRVQRLVEAVVSRPRVANRVLRRLAVATPAMDRLIEVTGDLRAPRSLISPRVVSSLVFPPDPETP